MISLLHRPDPDSLALSAQQGCGHLLEADDGLHLLREWHGGEAMTTLLLGGEEPGDFRA